MADEYVTLLGVECPSCAALPGQECRAADRASRSGHEARWLAWRAFRTSPVDVTTLLRNLVDDLTARFGERVEVIGRCLYGVDLLLSGVPTSVTCAPEAYCDGWSVRVLAADHADVWIPMLAPAGELLGRVFEALLVLPTPSPSGSVAESVGSEPS